METLRKNKWYLVLALLAVAAYVSYYYWQRRRITVTDYLWGGNFMDGRNNTAYTTETPVPYKVGDTVLIDYPDGWEKPAMERETIVEMVSEDRKTFVTDTIWRGSGKAYPGTVKLIKRA